MDEKYHGNSGPFDAFTSVLLFDVIAALDMNSHFQRSVMVLTRYEKVTGIVESTEKSRWAGVRRHHDQKWREKWQWQCSCGNGLS